MVPPQRAWPFFADELRVCEHRAMPRVTGRPPPLLPVRSQVIAAHASMVNSH